MTEIHRTAFGNCFQSMKNGFFLYGGSEKRLFENFLFKKICGPGLKIVLIESLGCYTTGSPARGSVNL